MSLMGFEFRDKIKLKTQGIKLSDIKRSKKDLELKGEQKNLLLSSGKEIQYKRNTTNILLQKNESQKQSANLSYRKIRKLKFQLLDQVANCIAYISYNLLAGFRTATKELGIGSETEEIYTNTYSKDGGIWISGSFGSDLIGLILLAPLTAIGIISISLMFGLSSVAMTALSAVLMSLFIFIAVILVPFLIILAISIGTIVLLISMYSNDIYESCFKIKRVFIRSLRSSVIETQETMPHETFNQTNIPLFPLSTDGSQIQIEKRKNSQDRTSEAKNITIETEVEAKETSLKEEPDQLQS